jgi:hypothetical protein
MPAETYAPTMEPPAPVNEQLDLELSCEAELPGCADQSQPPQLLALSQSRTYDVAVTILRAYKLTGNFPTELEIVLQDLGVLGDVTYEIKPKPYPSDVRLVSFRAEPNVDAERFQEITFLITSRIGPSPSQAWWRSLFDR